MVHRDMYLLESRDNGLTFRGSDISKWNVGYCVMSAEGLVSGIGALSPHGKPRSRFAIRLLSRVQRRLPTGLYPPLRTNQKYPSLAINRNGFLLIAWTEGMGRKHGGSLDW